MLSVIAQVVMIVVGRCAAVAAVQLRGGSQSPVSDGGSYGVVGSFVQGFAYSCRGRLLAYLSTLAGAA